MAQDQEDTLEQFDGGIFQHLYADTEYGVWRRVATFNTGFIDDGSGLVMEREWYAVAGLLSTFEPCIVIPVSGLTEMSDVDKLAAIHAGIKFAEIANTEANILRSDRLPYVWEAETLTLGGFRRRYAAEYNALRRYAYRSEIISKQFETIQPIWEGKNEESGFIYCLHDQLGHYKIGLTKHLNRRIKQLATQPPFNLTLICAFLVVNASKYESMLHDRYAPQRLNGEWFQLSPTEIDAFVKEHAGIDFITEEFLEATQNSNGRRLLPGQSYDY